MNLFMLIAQSVQLLVDRAVTRCSLLKMIVGS